MSVRPSRRLPSHLERLLRLLTYPSTQPLLHIQHPTLPIEAPKREREAAPHPLDGFDPMRDPEGCLRRFCAVWLAVRRRRGVHSAPEVRPCAIPEERQATV